MRIPLGKHHYQLRSLPTSAQRCVNMYFEPPIEGKTDETLYSTPGLELFATIGDGPIYGLHQMKGVLYVVSGNNVYSVDQFGGANNLGSMGTVANNVIMANNGTHVAIVLENGACYLATASALVQVTDGDFPSSNSVAILDFFGIFDQQSSARYYLSALNDLTSYDALDFATAESTSSYMVRAFAFNDELWLFKEDVTEVHYNTGDGDFPFVPRQNATIQRGCGAKRSVASENNIVYWLGDDRVVYAAAGYQPIRISTHAIEKELQGYTTVSDAEAFIYTQHGHKFYVLTFPTELATWVYDITTGLWHQRRSFEEGRWRATSHVFIFNENMVGDFENGNIYKLSLTKYTDNGATIERITTLPILFENDNRVTFANFKVDFDSGAGTISGQGANPQASMRYSDDGGRTWSNEIFRPIGKIGEYIKRAVWRRTGQARQRVYEVTVTDPVQVSITGAYINEPD